MENREGLESCPFCGGHELDKYDIGGNKYIKPMDTMVKCMTKGCMIYAMPFSIRKWNTRADRSQKELDEGKIRDVICEEYEKGMDCNVAQAIIKAHKEGKLYE